MLNLSNKTPFIGKKEKLAKKGNNTKHGMHDFRLRPRPTQLDDQNARATKVDTQTHYN
jgi:hypothetical protein